MRDVSNAGPVQQAALRGARALRRRARPVVDQTTTRARRTAFVNRTKAAAFWAGAQLDLEVAPDVEIGRGVRVVFERGSVNRLHIGPRCALEDRVLIRFAGGELDMVERNRLRFDVILNIGGGRLEMKADATLSWGAVVHCSEHVFLDEMAGAAEQVTIADTSHYFTTPDEFFWHNARSKPVYVGRNTWLCPKVSVGPGAHVGSHCIVASNSVVVGTVPDGSLASGIPAKARPMRLPWQDGPAVEAVD
jgi:acetyltransferase-like isoleucine patch superfamily enzyme